MSRIRDWWTALRVVWAVRPVSDRTLQRRMQNNMHDPLYWVGVTQAMEHLTKAVMGPDDGPQPPGPDDIPNSRM